MRRSLDDLVLFCALRSLLLLLQRLPVTPARLLARRLGSLAFLLGGRDRRRAEAQLQARLELSAPEARLTACEMYRRLGEGVAELLHLPSRDPGLGRCVAVEGLEHLEAAIARGRGVLWITGHIGNWELMAVKLVTFGPPLYVVARSLRYPRLDAWLTAFRTRNGMTVLKRGEDTSLEALTSVLARGGIIGLLIDQDLRVPGMMVSFLGQPAYTPVGAAHLAFRSGATALTGFIHRVGPLQHVLRIGPPIEVDAGLEPQAAVHAFLTEANRRIEAEVRLEPSDWPWFHARWKTRSGDRGV